MKNHRSYNGKKHDCSAREMTTRMCEISTVGVRRAWDWDRPQIVELTLQMQNKEVTLVNVLVRKAGDAPG